VGTRAERFVGLTLTPQAGEKQPPDGLRAHQLHLVMSQEEQKLNPEQRAKRDAMEAQVRALVARKADLKEEDYYRELETLMRQIAALFHP
jgi:hypothetical protein